MKGQPHRLYSHLALGGTALDRRLPLQFRLDGRLIHGFDGDTVLSAALAAGIDTLGEFNRSPIALSLRNAPAILPRNAGNDLTRALPMTRTPATNGADYLTLGPRSSGGLSRWISRLTGARRSLGLTLDQPLPQPWREQPGIAGPRCAVLVVGSGVAGMTAALRAAKAGKKVVLVEALPRLGGHARLFGSVEGEEAPDASIARLTDAIAATDAITVLTHAEAFAIRPGLVRVHVVERINGAPIPRMLDLHAPNIILATGTLERLPVFSGNRLPGIAGALEAFHLAHQYGVWPGRSALFATVSSPAYRLAMLAMDSAIAVPRILDDRPEPNSRFIEFAKAYGVTQATGTIPAAATQAGDQLTVTPRLDLGEFSHQEPDLSVDRLVVCGGWQPDLQLWLMAGGTAAWNAATAQMQAGSGPTGIALAGSAAGYRSHQAAMASGADAIAQVLGRKRRPVIETPIDTFYETPDAPSPLAPAPDGMAPAAFLDSGASYLTAPRPQPRTLWRKRQQSPQLFDAALSISDIAAIVQLGLVPPADAGPLAEERIVTLPLDAPAAHAPALPLPAGAIPRYLHGRFGKSPLLWSIAPQETRLLDIGSLIYHDETTRDPLHAVGVVLSCDDAGAIALLRAEFGAIGQTAILREPGRATAIRLIAPIEDVPLSSDAPQQSERA